MAVTEVYSQLHLQNVLSIGKIPAISLLMFLKCDHIWSSVSKNNIKRFRNTMGKRRMTEKIWNSKKNLLTFLAATPKLFHVHLFLPWLTIHAREIHHAHPLFSCTPSQFVHLLELGLFTTFHHLSFHLPVNHSFLFVCSRWRFPSPHLCWRVVVYFILGRFQN